MVDTALFLVTRDIALRSGLINVRYRTKDGRFILDNTDLSRVKIKSDEYLTGLKGVERISNEQAKRLIAENGYTMGDTPFVRGVQQEQEQSVDNGVQAVETTEEPNEETTEEAPAEEQEETDGVTKDEEE